MTEVKKSAGAVKAPAFKPCVVVATQRGYFNGLKEVGDKFRVESAKAFSDKWMKKV